MDRRQLVRRLVLEAICGDYENVDQIVLPSVAREGAELGLTIERQEIVAALGSLIQDGFAKAYLFIRTDGTVPFDPEIQGMPSLDVVEEDFQTYFYITQQGLDFHLSDDAGWPFDSEGNPR